MYNLIMLPINSIGEIEEQLELLEIRFLYIYQILKSI